MFLRRLILVLLLASLPLAAQKKYKGGPLYKLPPKTDAIEDLKLPAAAQPCTNYAWAIALETMLKVQSVSLDQHYWVQKASGGELCVDTLPDFDQLARSVNGTYTLDDSRKVRLEMQIIPGAPTSPDTAISPLQKGIPTLVFWKSRAYVLRSITYDEYLYPNGQRMFQIREMKMLDPIAPAKQREITFVNGTDDPGDIAGIILVTVSPLP